MTHAVHGEKAAGPRQRLFVYNSGFFSRPGLRQMLSFAGYDLRLGLPRAGDAVGVWGDVASARRGRTVAEKTGVPLVRIEDALLRSVHPGRARRSAPLGLMIDRTGLHFDGRSPSDLETLLASAPLDDSALLARARTGIERIRLGNLSKYTDFDERLAAPPPGYVLVVDQTAGDASLLGADRGRFLEMLFRARDAHPGARIVVKSHPETQRGLRPGHYRAEDLWPDETLLSAPVSPWALLEGAIAVYTVSSQLGFEAVLSGHRPKVFGQPFYAGWGLSDDEMSFPRRQRRLTRAQLFAGAMILAPLWVSPCLGRRCTFEEALDQLEAETRAFREDRDGYVAQGIRAWKRRHFQAFFGRERPVAFTPRPSEPQRRPMVWGAAGEGVVHVEDGFLRSRGLGARLVPPLSLVADGSGLYYDPTRPSALEALLAAPVPPGGELRAERLIEVLRKARISKYNLASARLPGLPEGHRILVPGQVEDDASITLGCLPGKERTTVDLLRRVRAENPAAVIIYKPHPDVEAGLRKGLLVAEGLADVVARQADPLALIEACDEVWTLTSTLGFEAVLRGKRVTCLGQPFYAGYGLTRDLNGAPARRKPVSLLRFAHAALIAYPRYHDPVSGLPCPPEVAVQRLTEPLAAPLRLRLMGAAQRALPRR